MQNVIRPLFTKFQKELVAFANTQYGRNFVSSFGGKELKENYPIVKVTPDSIHQQLDKKTFRAVFYPRSPFVSKFAEVLTMMDIAFENNKRIDNPKLQSLVIPHFLGETRLLSKELPQIYLASPETFYPDAGHASTTVDGIIAYMPGGYGTGVAWATIHDAVNGTGALPDTNPETFGTINGDTTANKWQNLTRYIALFDTSTLPNNALITGAVLSLYGQFKDDGLSPAQALSVVSSNPALNNNLGVADYSTLGTVQFANTIACGSWNTAGYNAFTLIPAGIAAISLTAITKLGSRLDSDRTNTEPTWARETARGGGYTADNATNKPKLVVTYVLTNIKKVSGVAYESIKKIAGVERASIKKIIGVA